MKKLNVSTKYSGDIRLASAIGRIVNILLVIGIIVFSYLGIADDGLYFMGAAGCLLILLIYFTNSAKLSALAGVAKAAEYYMAIVEQEYIINEIADDPKVEKFVDTKEDIVKKGTTSLPYKEGDFVFCEPKGCVVVVKSINKNNTITFTM